MVPDLEFVNNTSPFRFKIVTTGRDASGEELVKATVDQLQFVKVTGFATYWVAEYGVDGDVILDDKAEKLNDGEMPCRMKTVRKPIFEVIKPSDKILKIVSNFTK